MTTADPKISRALLGLIALTVIGVLAVGSFIGLGQKIFGGGGRAVTAVFANTQQLEPGDEVRVQGVLEGSVDSLTLNPGARTATVKMTVQDSAGPLYRNASATLRWKTLLGGAFYIALSRGDPSSGALGANVIPERHTQEQVELEDVLSVDKGGAKEGLRVMPGQLAKALRNPGPPTQALGTLADVAPSVADGVAAVRGEMPDSDLRSLVVHSAETVSALNRPNDEMRALIQGTAATVDVTATRAADIRAALTQAPGAFSQTRTTFSQLDTTLGLASPLLRRLIGSAGQVAPTVAQLYPTVVGADRLLHAAVPLLHALPRATESLASASQQALPLLGALTPSIDRLATTILPYLNTVDPASQHTTAEMIGPTFEALGPDIAGQEDQNGHFIRFPATGGVAALYLPCQQYATDPDATKLLDCESLQQALQSFLSYNPLQSVLGGVVTGSATSETPAASKETKR